MILVPSYNQPKLCPSATWNPDGITVANISLVGTTPIDFFIDTDNTIYVPVRSSNRIQLWLHGNMSQSRTLTINSSWSRSIFVTRNGDIYVDNSASNHRVDRWTLNSTNSVTAMYVTGICYGLFIDINDYLYCSLQSPHQVAKRFLNSDVNTSIIVAGTGAAGNTSDMLSYPGGIFIDFDFNLYVADCGNNRIQLFRSGQLNGTTMPINGSNGTFLLDCPTEIVLDIDGYLFITDQRHHRILGSGPTGFRCIVGCTGIQGSASNQLNRPHSLSFDSYGNLFVIEYGNSRLQKFFLSSNSCGKSSASKTFASSSQTYREKSP